MGKEKRTAKRIITGYKAEIFFEDKTYNGVIENLSATGASVTIVSQGKDLNFPPGKELKLDFEIQSGDKLSLNCIIRWSSKLQPNGLFTSIGMEIIDPNWEECSGFL